MRFLLPMLLALLLGGLAYQLPARTRIAVGELGDQLFLPSSEAQRAAQIERGEWYADQLGPDGRSRWSRERATIRLPGLGRGRPVDLTLHAAGWPTDTLRLTPAQPEVEVWVGQRLVGSFAPTAEIAPHTVTIPADAGPAALDQPLTVTLRSSETFTSTARYSDPRPKGIRLDAIEVASGGPGTWPDWLVLGGLALAATLTTALAHGRTRRGWLPLLAGAGVAVLGATALLVMRLWLSAVLPALLALLLLALLLAWWRVWRSLIRAVQWRLRDSTALDYGLIGALLLLCLYWLLLLLPPPGALLLATRETLAGDANDRYLRLLAQLSLLSGAALLLVVSVTRLPRWVLLLRRQLLTGRLAAVLLALLAGIWIGYELWLIMTLPFVGHADYSDNAVVARNLLRGRGFVVDYVSQFYALNPGGSVTRPQETWPLLQPLLMLPAFAIWGPTPFAARVPNIVFMAALTLLIYHIGARVWDRRVGLIAALLTLLNLFFFRLAIFATSDLALVVWSMAAFWLTYQFAMLDVGFWIGRDKDTTSRSNSHSIQSNARFGGVRSGIQRLQSKIQHPKSKILLAGVFTGLMILQKPSAAIFALGMGLWVLWCWERERRAAGEPLRVWGRRLLPLAAWTAITILVVLPYLARNMAVFGRPFFSTEAYDAWVLYFRGTGKDAWDDIYKIYTEQLGGPGRPDHTWVLRWGYDLTLGKLAQQARDAWSFFAPPRGTLLGYDVDGAAATWLLLLGLVTLRPHARRLIGLVAAALLLYVAFLIGYWHVHGEERYFVPFIPWLALVAAAGACWLFDRIAAVGRGRWAGFGGLALSVALISSVAPHWREIDAELDPKNPRYWGVDWRADLEAYSWLAANTPPDAVIMTRVPWQLNFHADRPAVMIPNAGGPQIMDVAQYYGADYLLTNGLSTSLPEGRGGALEPLATGAGLPGWELVHEVPDQYAGATIRIYRMPADYAWTTERATGATTGTAPTGDQ